MTMLSWESHWRIQPIYVTKAEERQVAANPRTKPVDTGHQSAYTMLSSTTTIAVYYNSTWKPIFILPSHQAQKVQLI